jgi:hypothetical protein
MKFTESREHLLHDAYDFYCNYSQKEPCSYIYPSEQWHNVSPLKERCHEDALYLQSIGYLDSVTLIKDTVTFRLTQKGLEHFEPPAIPSTAIQQGDGGNIIIGNSNTVSSSFSYQTIEDIACSDLSAEHRTLLIALLKDLASAKDKTSWSSRIHSFIEKVTCGALESSATNTLTFAIMKLIGH